MMHMHDVLIKSLTNTVKKYQRSISKTIWHVLCLHVQFEDGFKKVLVKRSNISRVGKLKHRAGFLESLQGGDSPVYKDQVGIFFSSCYCASWYSKCNCKKRSAEDFFWSCGCFFKDFDQVKIVSYSLVHKGFYKSRVLNISFCLLLDTHICDSLT